MNLADFPRKEYETRYRRLRRLMAKEDIDGLLISGDVNYQYLSGNRSSFAPWFTYSRPAFFILPLEGDPIIIAHSLFGVLAKRVTPWIKDIRTYSKMVGTREKIYPGLMEGLEQVKKALVDTGLDKARIGMEFGLEQRLGLPYLDLMKIKKTFPHACFLDASWILWQVRMIKSKAELSYMKKACEITNNAYDRTFESVRAGMTEIDVIKALRGNMVQQGADPMLGFYLIASEKPPGPSRLATNRKLKKGDVLWIDAGVVYKGYWCDFCRCIAIGKATEKQRETYKKVRKITMACIEAVKPRVKPSHLTKVCSDEFEKAGWRISGSVGRIGHGVGMNLTEPPSLADFDTVSLKAGMVLTMEPGVTAQDGKFVLEENFVVTGDGYELLTRPSSEELPETPI